MNVSLGIASVVVVVGAGVAQAAPLLVDFNERLNQTAVQSGWSGFVLNSSTSNFADGKYEGLTTTRTFGAYTVTVSDTNGTVSTQLPYLTDRYRTAPAGAGIALPTMLRDFVMADNAAAGQGLNVVVGGLVAGNVYEGRIWSYDHAQANNTTTSFLTDWTANGATLVNDYSSKGPAPTNDNDKSFVFSATADSNGQIAFQGLRDASSGGSGVVINGLELVAVPEPASIGLIGVGALGLLARRRSSRNA